MASTALVKSGMNVPSSPKKLLAAYLSAKRSVASMREKGEETVAGVVRTTETLGAAFVMSGIQGAYWDNVDKNGKKTYGLKVAGISLDLGVGIGLHLLGILGLGGRYSDHLKAFADGSLASYISTLGRNVGYKWAAERAKDKKTGATKGSLEDDIAAFIQG